MYIKQIYGGPGTGKTHRLLDILEKEMGQGVYPERVAFASFTKKSVNEAIDRVISRFELEREDMPYFRTLHSLCYNELGIQRSEVFNSRHVKKVGELLGVRITGGITPDDGPAVMPAGDRMLFLDSFARSVGRTLGDVWHDKGEDIPWLRVKQFGDTLQAYKNDFGLLDFTDMLAEYLAQCGPVPVDVAIIDEAQDLNPLQWQVAFHAFSDAKRIYIAGDDDQAIYKWSGADVNQFLSIPADEKEVLPVSHRLTKSVFNVAQSVILQVENRYSKEWKPNDNPGMVSWYRDINHVDITAGNWLCLARNSHFLKRFETVARDQGVIYLTKAGSSIDMEDIKAIQSYERLRQNKPVTGTEALAVLDRLMLPDPGIERKRSYMLNELWKTGDHGVWHDAFLGVPLIKREYYRSVLRRGEKVMEAPRIHIGTIHGSKGGEADNVLLLTDITKRTEDNYFTDPDDEHRVFYVGVTRAKKHLHVVLPQTIRHYNI